jgi:predicted transcriptional regulator
VASELTTQVKDFISRCVDSVEEMEVLFLLSNAKDKWWTSRAVYEDIKSSQASVVERLDGLVRKGVLIVKREGEPVYKYQPQNADLAASVEALASAYTERRLKVLEFLFSKPMAPLRVFSDAFRIRKDDKNG